MTAAHRNAQQKFLKSRKAELEYARKLRSVAKQVDNIVKGFTSEKEILRTPELVESLRNYSKTIRPWAESVGKKMLYDIARRDEAMWFELGNQIGRSFKKEIETAPVGLTLAEALNEQVELITSIPLEAAQRVHDLTMLGLSDSTRAKEIAQEILKTGQVCKSRATLIARTEVGRTATELTKARALHAGITHYYWRTSMDGDVRESHKEMNGKIFSFNEAPTLSDGTKCHAGAIYNCRCYPEPIIPDE